MSLWLIVCIIVGILFSISVMIVLIGDAIQVSNCVPLEEHSDPLPPPPPPPSFIERREVLDRGYVELIDYMGEDVDATVDAARVSFSKRADQFSHEKNLGLMSYLEAHKHTSPLEMTVFKFRIKAPVLVWWQLVRHRIASYNLQSGRYVPFDETESYRPDVWRLQSSDNKQGSDGELDPNTAEFLSEQRDELYFEAFALYHRMLEAGIAKEQARLVLPFGACYYTGIVCINARSLKNFLGLRLGKDAQSEIRWYAEAVDDILKTTHPETFK